MRGAPRGVLGRQRGSLPRWIIPLCRYVPTVQHCRNRPRTGRAPVIRGTTAFGEAQTPSVPRTGGMYYYLYTYHHKYYHTYVPGGHGQRGPDVVPTGGLASRQGPSRVLRPTIPPHEDAAISVRTATPDCGSTPPTVAFSPIEPPLGGKTRCSPLLLSPAMSDDWV